MCIENLTIVPELAKTKLKKKKRVYVKDTGSDVLEGLSHCKKDINTASVHT